MKLLGDKVEAEGEEALRQYRQGLCADCAVSVLYAAYITWTEADNEYKMSHRKFSMEPEKRFEKCRKRDGYVYYGLRLLK